MPRWLLALVFAVVMPCYACSAFGVAQAAAAATGEVQQASGDAIDADGSDPAAVAADVDGASDVAELIDTAPKLAPPAMSTAPPTLGDPQPASAFVEGPSRPPRSLG